ncbi:MAG: hypothetical protein M3025_03165 [Actinomycetota bacterium]|nr:hypothetical protein [Actinomycetota bacterium]
MRRRRSHWGWGYEDEQPSADELRCTAAFLAGHLGFASPDPETPVPAVGCRHALAASDPSGGAHRDLLDRPTRTGNSLLRPLLPRPRARLPRAVRCPPDVVARRDEEQLRQVLRWALSEGAAVIRSAG